MAEMAKSVTGVTFRSKNFASSDAQGGVAAEAIELSRSSRAQPTAKQALPYGLPTF